MLELQHSITVAQLNNVLRGHIITLRNRDNHLQQLTAVAANAASSSVSGYGKKKASTSKTTPLGKPSTNTRSTVCDHCGFCSHATICCCTKQIDDLRKEIEELKSGNKSHPRQRTAKAAAQISEVDSDSSVEEVAKTTSKASKIRFSRSAKSCVHVTINDSEVYNMDSGTTDNLVKSADSVDNAVKIPSTFIHLADDSSINATSVGVIKIGIDLSPTQGLIFPMLTENLLSVGQLADNNILTLFGKNKVDFFLRTG